MPKRALGKGIEALLQSSTQEKGVAGVEYIELTLLRPNEYQPRKDFPDENLAELAQSIRQKGILQPLLVESEQGGTFSIVAGERRYRAAALAGLDRVPAIVRRFTKLEKLEIALIENLQREDLKPLEEARAYQMLLERAKLSQEEIARRVGKKRSTIANALRLLRLPEGMAAALDQGKITPGHARAILSLQRRQDQEALFGRLLSQQLSVRQAERLAAELSGPVAEEPETPGRSVAREGKKSPELQSLEQQLIDRLGTKVQIKGTDRRGSIEIQYYSLDDLERIRSIIAPPEDR